MGDMDAAEKIEEVLSASSTSLFDDNDKHMKSSKLKADYSKELLYYEQKYQAYLSKHPKQHISFHLKSIQRDLIESFWKMVTKSSLCENCGYISPKIRKDGYSKLFLRPPLKRTKKLQGKVSAKVRKISIFKCIKDYNIFLYSMIVCIGSRAPT